MGNLAAPADDVHARATAAALPSIFAATADDTTYASDGRSYVHKYNFFFVGSNRAIELKGEGAIW